MLEQLSSVFFDEANELLDNLEEQLLALSDNNGDPETIAAVFRAMHTIKGSSAMFGFNEISTFTHEAESAMDQVRNGVIPVTPELIDLLLKTRDHIRSLLDAGAEVSEEVHKSSEALILEFKVYVQSHGGNATETASSVKKIEPKKADENTATWRIKFRPSSTIMQNGTRPELLIKELTELGTATVVPFYNDLPVLSEMDSELCYFSWDVILTTTKTKNDIEDVFIFLDSESKIEVEKIDLLPGENNKIGEILVSRKDVSQDDVDEILKAKKQLGLMLVEKKIVSEKPKLFILCSPHNPGGRVWKKEELSRIAEICLKHKVVVVSDEIHSDIVFNGSKHTVFSTLSNEAAENSVICTSPSKTFNLAGLQISNIIIKNKSLRAAFQKEVDKTGYDEPSLMGLEAAMAVYEEGADWFEEAKAHIWGNIEFAKDFIKEHCPRIKVMEPEGTYLLWLDFSDFTEFSDLEISERVLRKAKVWLDYGKMFGEEGAKFQRINCATPRPILEEALRRICGEFD